MSRKSAFWLAASLAAVVALAPALAEARAGRGSSMGSRGSHTQQAVPSTPTAPAARPMERSATTPQQRQAQPAAQPAAAAQGGFMQRNPFMAGMLGGLIGVGLGGLLFGSGLFGEGLAGFAGFLGLLLQGALIAGVVYFAVAWFRRRQQGGAETPRPAYAYAGNEPASPDTAQRRAVMDVAPLDLNKTGDLKTGQGGGAPGAPAASIADDLGLGEKDYAAFEERLVSIQKAWSEGDLAALRQHATPEMLSYFSESLSADASAGISNRVEDAVFEQGDLAEAWSEGNLQYATVAIRFRARDYTVRLSDGAVVEGNASEPVTATEVWTFLRNGTDGRWLLSAIQQV